jgi:hypothetical protein
MGMVRRIKPKHLTIYLKQFLPYRLDVNYGGSSGYGRKYIERLVNNWGIVDVRDCVGAPQALAKEPYNLVDGKRLFIRGGSAGGFTVLAALTIAPDVTVFAGGTSLYGVSDLGKLAEFTHKFESRYLDHLLGGTREEVPAVYHDRSPINSAEKIVTPLLVRPFDMIMQLNTNSLISKDFARRDRHGCSQRSSGSNLQDHQRPRRYC